MVTHRNTRPLVAIEPPMESSTSRHRMYLKLNGQINRNASVRPFLTKALCIAHCQATRYTCRTLQIAFCQLFLLSACSATDSLLSIEPAIGRSATECLVSGKRINANSTTIYINDAL